MQRQFRSKQLKHRQILLIKRKTTQIRVAGLEQVTSETSGTFPSPLLLPLPYGQHFTTAKTEGTCFASFSQILSATKQKNHAKMGG